MRRTGEYGKSSVLPRIVPSEVSPAVSNVGSVSPFCSTASRKTVKNSVRNRSRLNGAASRNSTMLGKLELYSTKVSEKASSATRTVIWLLSAATPGSNSAGVAMSNATRKPRVAAPVIRPIKVPPFQTGQPRYFAAVLFQLDAPIGIGACLIIAQIVPSFPPCLKTLGVRCHAAGRFACLGAAFLHLFGEGWLRDRNILWGRHRHPQVVS